jgi:hypothetical protein
MSFVYQYLISISNLNTLGAVILQLYLDYLCISIGFYKNLRDGYRFENVVYNEGSSMFV